MPGRDTVDYAMESGAPASAAPETDADAADRAAIPSADRATAFPGSQDTPESVLPRSLDPASPAAARSVASVAPEIADEAVDVPPALDEPAVSEPARKAAAGNAAPDLEEVERRARPLPAEPVLAEPAGTGIEAFEEEGLVPTGEEPGALDEAAPLEVVRDPGMDRSPETEMSRRPREDAVLSDVEEPAAAPLERDPGDSGDPVEWNDSVVARVNGAPILFSELKEYALDQNLPISGLRVDGVRGDAFRQAMTARVDQTLLVQAATLEDMTADQLDVARRVDAFIAQRIDEAGGRAEFLDMLRGAQLNLESFRGLLIKRETQRQLAAGIVQQRVTINTQELEAFKKQRREAGEPIEEVQLAQILVACPPREQGTPLGDEMFRKALDLAARAGRQPAAFSKILTELNGDPTGRTRGGLLGWIDPSTLQPAVRDAVAKLHPGEVSPPVTTDAGYHVLFMLERRDARDMLYSRKFEEQRNKLINELRAKAQIEIYPLEGAG